MDTIAYSNLEKNFPSIMAKVCDDHNPVIISNDDLKPVVLMSRDRLLRNG